MNLAWWTGRAAAMARGGAIGYGVHGGLLEGNDVAGSSMCAWKHNRGAPWVVTGKAGGFTVAAIRFSKYLEKTADSHSLERGGCVGHAIFVNLGTSLSRYSQLTTPDVSY